MYGILPIPALNLFCGLVAARSAKFSFFRNLFHYRSARFRFVFYYRTRHFPRSKSVRCFSKMSSMTLHQYLIANAVNCKRCADESSLSKGSAPGVGPLSTVDSYPFSSWLYSPSTTLAHGYLIANYAVICSCQIAIFQRHREL